MLCIYDESSKCIEQFIMSRIWLHSLVSVRLKPHSPLPLPAYMLKSQRPLPWAPSPRHLPGTGRRRPLRQWLKRQATVYHSEDYDPSVNLLGALGDLGDLGVKSSDQTQ